MKETIRSHIHLFGGRVVVNDFACKVHVVRQLSSDTQVVYRALRTTSDISYPHTSAVSSCRYSVLNVGQQAVCQVQ